MTSMPPTTSLPDLPSQTGTAELLGYGRISWGQLTSFLADADAEAAWADYSGFHIGPVPAEPPPYSHLWAWSSQWLARVRIDNGTAITGVLALHDEPHSAPPVISRETVQFQHARAATWPQTEKRVGLAAQRHSRPTRGHLPDPRRPPDHLRRRSSRSFTRQYPAVDFGNWPRANLILLL